MLGSKIESSQLGKSLRERHGARGKAFFVGVGRGWNDACGKREQLNVVIQVFPYLLQIAKSILKSLFLLRSGLKGIEKLFQSHAAFHPRSEGKEMSQRPGLHIKQVSILLAASERSALIKELGQWDARLGV